jgi:transcriptional regulator GlxA family with amidase domain
VRDQQQILETRGLSAARLRAAKVLVRRQLTDPELSPESVAGRLGISVRTLQRLFEQTGTTFSAFVIRERLETAHAALRRGRGRRSIADIALESGFGDISHFNRKFRALYHASPSEIRRSAVAASNGAALEER